MRFRKKSCYECSQVFDVLFRASVDSKYSWKFYCEKCLLIVKKENKDYTYGGTWKSKKR